MTPPGARDNPVSLGAILHEKRAAGRAALWTGSGLAVPPALEHALEALLERLEAESGAPIVLTALGNTEPGLNPFAGLGDGAAPEPDGERAAQLVATWYGPPPTLVLNRAAPRSNGDVITAAKEWTGIEPSAVIPDRPSIRAASLAAKRPDSRIRKPLARIGATL